MLHWMNKFIDGLHWVAYNNAIIHLHENYNAPFEVKTWIYVWRTKISIHEAFIDILKPVVAYLFNPVEISVQF